jgi:ribosomal protein S12 methylthiotransferase accessory factor
MVEYPARTWADAAAALESELGFAPAADAEDLLRRLGYEMAGLAVPSGVTVPGHSGSLQGRPDAAASARLLRFAARLVRAFEWPLPDAPGGIFIGAEADPENFGLRRVGGDRISMGAADVTFLYAFQRCTGEGIEYLSQIADGSEAGEVLRFEDLAALHGLLTAGEMALMLGDPEPQAGTSFACMATTSLLDQRQLAVPSDLCLRTPESRLRAAASTGCAAGQTYTDACLGGLLELVERDAAALWWEAGRPARPLPLEALAAGGVVALLHALRRSMRSRRTFMLDITSDIGVPVVAAVSVDARNRGFACGLGAAVGFADAAKAALLELCQLELAQHVVRLKMRERGPAGLNPTDQAHLVRSEAIDLEHCSRLWPCGAAADSPLDSEAPRSDTGDARLRWVAERVAAIAGRSPMVVDLTRVQFGIPVVKVIAPGLQLYPATIVTKRLQQAKAQFGGTLAGCGGVGLL